MKFEFLGADLFLRGGVCRLFWLPAKPVSRDEGRSSAKRPPRAGALVAGGNARGPSECVFSCAIKGKAWMALAVKFVRERKFAIRNWR
jgi:hypothetical protein